jgi:hypothetical protein
MVSPKRLNATTYCHEEADELNLSIWNALLEGLKFLGFPEQRVSLFADLLLEV